MKLQVELVFVVILLQGACGTCASSTATMKMGIERALRVRPLLLVDFFPTEL